MGQTSITTLGTIGTGTWAGTTIAVNHGGTGLTSATDSAILVSNSSGVPAWSGTMTNGQVIIGYTSGTPTAATISAGAGISVTNGTGSITIASTGGITWNSVITTTVTAAVNNGYIITEASATTVTLPVTAALGSVVEVIGQGAGGFSLAAGIGQTIQMGTVATTSGGSWTSANQYDAIRVVCTVANTTWTVTSVLSAGMTKA